MATKTLEDVATRIPTADRTISPDGVARIKAILDTTPHVPVQITSIVNSSEAFDLAQQMKMIFEQSGFKVDGINQAMFSRPIKGIVITSSSEVIPPPLGSALLQIFKELNVEPVGQRDPNMAASAIAITVGEK